MDETENMREAEEAVKRFGTKAEAARQLGIPNSTLKHRLNRAANPINPSIPDKTLKFEKDDRGNNQTITSVSHKVRTLEDALAKAEIDQAIWEVERCVVNSWEVAMLIKRDGQHEAVTSPLWQVKVWLRRKVPKSIEDGTATLMARIAKHAPKYHKVKYPKLTDPHMLEISVFDAHFAKMAWGRETGTDYDLNIAEKVYSNAVKDLVAKTAAYPIDYVLMPIGQDFFHVDNPNATTVNGTPQDTDGRYAKMFETGVMACVNAIDYLINLAPVKILWVPGNHDRTVSWHLVSELKAWYRKCKNVTVDVEPTQRKYELYGVNLIGFTHGDEEPHRELPNIMSGECAGIWAEGQWHEWHLGHFHKKKEMRTLPLDSFGGTVVRVLPSLSGTDAWHFKKGYVQGKRAAEAFLWSKKNGYTGHFSSNVAA